MASVMRRGSDAVWSCEGLPRREALRMWREWAANTIAPIDVAVFDIDHFTARWVNRGIGDLRMLHLHAPAQRVVHTGATSSNRVTPTIQLVYARRGGLKTTMAGKSFWVRPGEFVLLDNTRFYHMEMPTAHEALDLMMPRGWLERFVPDPAALLSRPVAAHDGWVAPLGALLHRLMTNIDEAPVPREIIADQIGHLLTLIAGRSPVSHEPQAHRHHLIEQIRRRIRNDYADPDLSVARVATDLGISQRHLQVLLAAAGTSFVQELNATRLDRARQLMSLPSAAELSISDVAGRVGFLDAGYFTRRFRRRFGMPPSQWRQRHTPTE